jgi:hypothetical protein
MSVDAVKPASATFVFADIAGFTALTGARGGVIVTGAPHALVDRHFRSPGPLGPAERRAGREACLRERVEFGAGRSPT